ncbi:unnamed protein product [Mesocestoides corti]|uniref:Uncharacterized protein n=1 Tax=Mesocestoides corti TaxID=53468 RepID=A0A0R3UP19_MESCO|nr:unnamed protein product [Mesocestoides corti]
MLLSITTGAVPRKFGQYLRHDPTPMRHSDPVVDANMYQQARNRRPPPFPPPPQPHRLRHERGRQADDLSSEFYSPPATPFGDSDDKQVQVFCPFGVEHDLPQGMLT